MAANPPENTQTGGENHVLRTEDTLSEKIRKLIENDKDQKLEKLGAVNHESNNNNTNNNGPTQPQTPLPLIPKDVFSEVPLASQLRSGSVQLRSRDAGDVNQARQKRLLQFLFAGQIIRAVVISVRPHIGVLVRLFQMIDLDGHESTPDMKSPESLFSISITMLCPPEELGDGLTAQLSAEVLPRFTVGDQVKAIIISMGKPTRESTAFGTVSFRSSRVPSRESKIQLGLDKSPFDLDTSVGMMYENPSSELGQLNQAIVSDSAFGNPYVLSQMFSIYCLDEHGSFFPARPAGLYSNGDSWEKLRDMQNRQWANEMVTKGVVEHARRNDFESAIKCYNQVLAVTPLHVDALVARGAAFANQKHFAEAAADFQKALEVQPDHENAKKYLTTVQAKLDEEKKRRKVDTAKTQIHSTASTATTTANANSSNTLLNNASSSTVLKSSSDNKEKKEKHHHKKEKEKKRKKEKNHHKHKKEKKKRKSLSSSSSSSSDSSSSSIN